MWPRIDLPRRTARQADTKTGASLRALSRAARAVIGSQPPISDPVFPSRSGEKPIVGYRKMWSSIAKLGDLPADIAPMCCEAGASIPPMPYCWWEPMQWRAPP